MLTLLYSDLLQEHILTCHYKPIHLYNEKKSHFVMMYMQVSSIITTTDTILIL